MNPFYSIQKLVESFLGFKQKKTIILTQRNSLLKLLILINIPNLILLYLVNRIVQEPYMDQEFHYRQFKTFFQGEYSVWDPKITTPPGLYHIQVLVAQVFGDSLTAMRTVNALVFGNTFAIFVMKVYEFKDRNFNNLSRALNLALTPTVFFFNFLDYTDTLSLALVAMLFYYNLVKSNWRLALVSLLALYVRQNNIVWLVYMMLYRVLSDYRRLMFSPKPFFGHVFSIIRVTFTHKVEIIKQMKLQLAVIAIFFGYLRFYNEGQLVFGDRENHRTVFHPTQLLYLALFMILNIPINIDDYISNVSSILQKLSFSRHFLSAYLMLLSVSIIVVDKYTMVHPFILADNRHFTFYIYRRAVQFWFVKWIACLVYPLAILFLFRVVVNSDEKLFKFLLWVSACIGYLSLSELVEFRYFSIPLLIYSLQIENKNVHIDIEKVHKNESNINKTHRMIWTTLFKVLLNTVVFTLFLGWQFNNDFGNGRIMW